MVNKEKILFTKNTNDNPSELEDSLSQAELKRKEREEIAELTEKFLASGGKVTFLQQDAKAS